MKIRNSYKYIIAILIFTLGVFYFSPVFQNWLFHGFKNGAIAISSLTITVSEDWYPIAKDKENNSILFNKVKCKEPDECILEIRGLGPDHDLDNLIVDAIPSEFNWGRAYLINEAKKSYGMLNTYYVKNYNLGITVSGHEYLSHIKSIDSN